ncbi:MAG: phosphopentomutase [Candidatus Hydrogenedentota bacterium]|nr:MAG: phosphopentomutase [Candidatus Hydrogenedentota bacterium]
MISKVQKTVLIVLDSLGVGETPDADMFGDRGSNTLGHIAEAVGGLNLPNLSKLGIGNLTFTKGVDRTEDTIGFYGKMREQSNGKDTCVGHWEIAGLPTEVPFETFPNGFPEELLEKIEEQTGITFLGNVVASGTEIIKKLGPEHEETGKPILYTSADSVLQIAAHEEVFPVDKLYQLCKDIRPLATEYRIARVIARPFIGSFPSYTRTDRRKDFTVSPPGNTVLDAFVKKSIPVISIGKTGSIFNYQGVTEDIHTKDNADGMETTLRQMREGKTNEIGQALIFTNLVDFDSKYGHRRNPQGYAKALEEFDAFLPNFQRALGDEDLLILTADHGNDPTFHGTDHTREHVPVLVYSRKYKPNKNGNLGVRKTFADIAQTLAEAYELDASFPAESFWPQIIHSS